MQIFFSNDVKIAIFFPLTAKISQKLGTLALDVIHDKF